MPRRSSNVTEKASDSPVVERRSTRSSARKSLEASDVTSPEKQKTEDKPSPVKASPSQSGTKRGRPAKRQSAATADDKEQTTVEEGTKMDVDQVKVDSDAAVGKSQEVTVTESDSTSKQDNVVDAPTESAAGEVPVSPVKDEVAKETKTIGEEAEKTEEPAENKKRQRDEDSDESSAKKPRSDDTSTDVGASKTDEGSKSAGIEETPALKVEVSATDEAKDSKPAAVESMEEAKSSDKVAPKIEDSKTGVAVNGACETPSSDATVAENVADIPSTKKSITTDAETAGEDDVVVKQNGCHETAELAAADVSC